MDRVRQLAERRAALIERVAQQRTDIARVYRQFERPASIFDKGFSFARSVRSHPVITLAIGLAAVVYWRKQSAIGKVAGMALTGLRIGLAFVNRSSSRKRGVE